MYMLRHLDRMTFSHVLLHGVRASEDSGSEQENLNGHQVMSRERGGPGREVRHSQQRQTLR